MDLGWSEFSSSFFFFSPPVLTKGHIPTGFCGGGAPGYGGMFGYEEGAPGNLGAVGGEPSRGAGFLLLVVRA